MKKYTHPFLLAVIALITVGYCGCGSKACVPGCAGAHSLSNAKTHSYT